MRIVRQEKRSKLMLSEAEVVRLGFTPGEQAQVARQAADALSKYGHGKKRIRADLKKVLQDPERFLGHGVLDAVARALTGAPASVTPGLRPQPVPHRIWGRQLMDQATIDQFMTACRLPVAVRGAQMPDGHVGYGLPIGGVLATHNSVIPYGVGVDIACRMRLSIFDEPVDLLQTRRDALKQSLQRETRFGVGVEFRPGERRRHEVMDDPSWTNQPLLRELKDKAWAQLGTSGSGNHFVEWGELDTDGVPEIDLPAGRYLALLSHSGSRGFGATVADHFTRVAKAVTRMPDEAKQLAWLDLDSEEGAAYWEAMNLAGRYAAANHWLVHHHVARAAGLEPRAHVENHHNFAWLEEHDGERVVVHRKGATPAGQGVLGVIPGSMGDPGYVVRGKGDAGSLTSASHGAGRVMSRKKAVQTLTAADRRRYLDEAGVELLAGGLDESPQVYKRIDEVMAEQHGLVDAVAKFRPRLVLMAAGGRAED